MTVLLSYFTYLTKFPRRIVRTPHSTKLIWIPFSQAGIITFGAMPITDDKISDAEISGAIRQNLRRNILAGIDLSTGSVAACVLMGGRDNLDNIPQDSIETAFEQLNRLLGDGSTSS